MRIQFDLRPADMVEKERKKTGFNLTRLVAIVLMMAFFVSTIGYITMTTFSIFTLRDEIETGRLAVVDLQRRTSDQRGRLNSLIADERVFANALQIMNDDLPTIEVLRALEQNMGDYGIGFETLRFVTAAGGNTVEVVGQAAYDRQIIEFSDRLRLAGVFSNVFLPLTTLNENTGMISFTLRMPVHSISEITITP